MIKLSEDKVKILNHASVISELIFHSNSADWLTDPSELIIKPQSGA